MTVLKKVFALAFFALGQSVLANSADILKFYGTYEVVRSNRTGVCNYANEIRLYPGNLVRIAGNRDNLKMTAFDGEQGNWVSIEHFENINGGKKITVSKYDRTSELPGLPRALGVTDIQTFTFKDETTLKDNQLSTFSEVYEDRYKSTWYSYSILAASNDKNVTFFFSREITYKIYNPQCKAHLVKLEIDEIDAKIQKIMSE